MNRRTRDEIIQRALNLVDSPSLDEKDRPAGAINEDALSLGWFQDGLDLAHNLYPFAGVLKNATINFVAGTDLYTLPTDFIIDYQDGIVIQSTTEQQTRMHKRGLSHLLNFNTSLKSLPRVYTIKGTQAMIRPIPEKAYVATLTYYSLPLVMTGATIPTFPSDWMLVEFIRLKGKEWAREIEPGTAELYMTTALSRLVKAGLLSEAESDQVPQDTHYFGEQVEDRNAWMGLISP